MALILQTKENIGGSEKLYRDALVADGTLLLVDFSNRGTLHGYSVAKGFPVRDLARESSEVLGIKNSTRFNYEDSTHLSEGLGLWCGDWGSSGYNDGDPYGVDFGKDLMEYIVANKEHEFLITVWVRVPSLTGFSGGRVIASMGDVGGSGINLNITNQGIPNLFFGGIEGRFATIDPTTDVLQRSIHYRGTSNTMRNFTNGEFGRETLTNPNFEGDYSNLVLGRNTGNPSVYMYRILVEDLTVSGRVADTVVKDDWDYNNGTGKYGYMEKRPFIDQA
ncbi:MAG TPA: hypothetical protein H9853_06570 [Candidatus Sphingobacterium stercoripullorum]|uniref:Uncharacterized protein n=1 Tax=Candidatus Sphingobacterium stercoripullorum TaxID=2838759 RepID=A0A9D2AZA2_9SPHI|nr:hypothetical protein [Candidatus Sphingobacterium stercoripullorum]